jgi:hypothetical protein
MAKLPKYRDDGELDEWDREQSAKGRAASMAAPVVPPLTPEK